MYDAVDGSAYDGSFETFDNWLADTYVSFEVTIRPLTVACIA